MTSEVTFALAIPHTPWVPARVESVSRLHMSLAPRLPSVVAERVFDERAPNWKWSLDLWRWGASTSATHLVQLQDDVVVAPGFWSALMAMVSANPEQVIGLQGAHPAFRALSRDGVRWARSRAWMVGCGYVIPRDPILRELVGYRESTPFAELINEDELITRFCVDTQRAVWHPIPTIIDHDTEIESTYGNDHHRFRRPTVTWRDFAQSDLEREEFWRVSQAAPYVVNPHLQSCWACAREPVLVRFQESGIGLGYECLQRATHEANQRLRPPEAP